MTTGTVPTGPPDREASHAYALYRMGEALRDLPDFRDVWICIQPGRGGVAAENRARVDAVAQALFGKDGTDETRSGGMVHDANGLFGPIRVSITARVPGPPDERDAEIERLRAQVAELRGAEDPDHGRTTAVAGAKPDTLGVALGRASVPDPDGGE